LERQFEFALLEKFIDARGNPVTIYLERTNLNKSFVSLHGTMMLKFFIDSNDFEEAKRNHYHPPNHEGRTFLHEFP